MTRFGLLSATTATCAALAAATPYSPTRAPAHPPHAVTANVTAFVHVGVVPMDREGVLRDQTVLVANGRITAMGPATKVRIPGGAVQIDGHGKFLLPGLADMHAHIFSGTHTANVSGGFGMSALEAPDADSAMAEAKLFLWLANGVTTIRNVDYHEDAWGKHALQFRARAAAGTAWFPRIYTAGQWGPLSYIWAARFNNDQPPAQDSVEAYVAAYKAAGYDLIKVHFEDSVTLVTLLAAAKKVGIPLVGHVPPPSRVERILPLGYKSIEHPFTDYLWGSRMTAPSPDTSGFGALAGAMRRNGVWHCPTQAHYDRFHMTAPVLLKVEQDSGVKLLLGTDEVPWIGVITRELQAMVAAGLTPYQALLTGTRNVAEYFGTLDSTGTIATGKRADLILLTGNPLEDVRYTAQPAGVMIGGRWLPREEINRRVAGLTLASYDDDAKTVTIAPVKSYWANVMTEVIAASAKVLQEVPITLADTQQTRLGALRATQQAQRKALVDSLGTSDRYAEGMQRIYAMIGRQFGEMRGILTSAQQASFDAPMRTWVQQRRKDRYTVSVPGVE